MSHGSGTIRSKRVVTPDGVREVDVVFSEGVIRDICPYGSSAAGEGSLFDVGHSVVMPGLVDSHVHINEPGRTEWEGFETATHAAAAGGITTLIDMPLNCTPVTTSAAALQTKLDSLGKQLWVDCGFWGGCVPENQTDLVPLIQAGVFGVKAFLIHSGIDDFPNVTEDDLRRAMPVIAQAGVPLLVHAELDRSGGPVIVTDKASYDAYLASRPKQWELDAIELMIGLCRETGCPVHIVHLSCADALPMLREARAEGLPVTVETCSHYLTLYSEEVETGDTRYKCAPPIREKANSEALWRGLEEGVIDFIVSDHSPCTPELKLLDQGDFAGAWGGISSLQFGLSVIWTEAHKRGYSLEQLTQWLSLGQAQFVGLETSKGQLRAGCDADVVIWEPEADVVVDPSTIEHRHKITPYEGKHLKGRVQQTMLRGQIIYNDGEFSGPAGRPLFRRVPAVSGGSV